MYVSSDVADKVKKLAKDRGITLSMLMNSAGVGNNTMSNFKTSMPRCDTLAKIADCLDCSIDYLLGRADFTEEQVSSNTEELSEDEKWILNKLKEMDDDGMIAIRGVILAEHRRVMSKKD